MSTTKLWISDKLELMWNEWPNRDDFDSSTEYRYLNELAKAKAESIPVDGGDIPGSLTHALMTAEPDSFIDYAGDVEVIDQWKHTGVGGTGEWRTDTENACWTMANGGMDTRKVARLKPVNSARGFSEGAEFSSDSTKVFPVSTGQLIENNGLKARILEAFNRKISMGEAHWEIDRVMKQSLAEVLDELNIK